MIASGFHPTYPLWAKSKYLENVLLACFLAFINFLRGNSLFVPSFATFASEKAKGLHVSMLRGFVSTEQVVEFAIASSFDVWITSQMFSCMLGGRVGGLCGGDRDPRLNEVSRLQLEGKLDEAQTLKNKVDECHKNKSEGGAKGGAKGGAISGAHKTKKAQERLLAQPWITPEDHDWKGKGMTKMDLQALNGLVLDRYMKCHGMRFKNKSKADKIELIFAHLSSKKLRP